MAPFHGTALLLGLLLRASAGLEVLGRSRKIYDTRKILKINGSGFSSAKDLALTFSPPISASAYKILIPSDDEMVLELERAHTWAQLEPGTSKNLYLTSLTASGEQQLQGDVQVAEVIPTPKVTSSSQLIYNTATQMLLIEGQNFNLKSTSLFFDPPLPEGIVFQKKILSSTEIQLIKNYGQPATAWHQEGAGPLKLKAIDTGAGMVYTDPELGGTLLAQVQADLGGHGVAVDKNEAAIYQSTPSFIITGTGFETAGTKLLFANGIRAGGKNYTAEYHPESITMTLVPGKKWRRNTKALPGPLVLLAADAGAGPVGLGPAAAVKDGQAAVSKKGQTVATVFEDPSVSSSNSQLMRSVSHSLTINGQGFNNVAVPRFTFSPPLSSDNFSTLVIDANTVELVLRAGGAWMKEGASGALSVVEVDTGAGLVKLPEPVLVAMVKPDGEVHDSGVTVFVTHDQMAYQSVAPKPLKVKGAGLHDGCKLEMSPTLVQGTDFVVEVVDENTMHLTLQPGKEWRDSMGTLYVKSIDCGAGAIPVGDVNGHGAKLAVILENPVISEQDLKIYASHSKHFTIRGVGLFSFFNPLDYQPVLELDSVPSSYYTLHSPSQSTITVALEEGKLWAKLNKGSTAEIKVTAIDAGAGLVRMPGNGVHVATVHADEEGTICEDTCYFALDGVCDEPQDGSAAMSRADPYSSFSDYSLDDGYFSSLSSSVANGVAFCNPREDCTDCGVRVVEDGMCSNECTWRRDGECDDPRGSGLCASGTDCQDCGPVGASNFTKFDSGYSSYSYYNSDFNLNPEVVMQGQENNAKGAYQRMFSKHAEKHQELEGAGGIFVDVLWAVVVLIGGSVSAGFCFLAYKHVKGESTPGQYLPVMSGDEKASQGQEFELPAMPGSNGGGAGGSEVVHLS